MNTLHWHITDAQSFPIIVEALPNLAMKGAYAYPGKILCLVSSFLSILTFVFIAATYSHQDVQLVVQYGYERGIRVVPEFDVPGNFLTFHVHWFMLCILGHTYSWGLGYPNLIINCSGVLPDWDILKSIQCLRSIDYG